MNIKNKKLHRSKTNRMWYGVLGGLGEYLEMDPTVLRLIFILLLIFTGIFPFVLFYFLAVIIIPEE